MRIFFIPRDTCVEVFEYRSPFWLSLCWRTSSRWKQSSVQKLPKFSGVYMHICRKLYLLLGTYCATNCTFFTGNKINRACKFQKVPASSSGLAQAGSDRWIFLKYKNDSLVVLILKDKRKRNNNGAIYDFDFYFYWIIIIIIDNKRRTLGRKTMPAKGHGSAFRKLGCRRYDW